MFNDVKNIFLTLCSERSNLNNAILRSVKFVWHTALLYRINYIIYSVSDYFSHYIYPIRYVLNSMRRQICPISILLQLLEFCKMLLKFELIRRLMIKFPISLMESNAMIIYLASHPKLML